MPDTQDTGTTETPVEDEDKTSTKDLGAVTAYGEALEAGYSGTYEEFCEMLANYAKTAAEVKEGIKTAQENAEAAAKSAESAAKDVITAKSYSEGGTGTREGEDSDNAKHYAEQAKANAEAASVGMTAATTTTIGGVKPDDQSIKVKSDGTLYVPIDKALSSISENPVQNKAIKLTLDALMSSQANMKDIQDKFTEWHYIEDLEQVQNLLPMDYSDGTLTIPKDMARVSDDGTTVILAKEVNNG